jgi:hypothetical protein
MHLSKVYSIGFLRASRLASRNDKQIARTNTALMNVRKPNDWLREKSWEVICDSKGVPQIVSII